MPANISIEGPIEIVEGKLMLRIPLDVGGFELSSYAGEISSIDGENLVVEIKPWLAEELGIGEGSLVHVDNHNGKFTITRNV